jgi:RNA polymerase sigma-70 factor (ECF subfamily)
LERFEELWRDHARRVRAYLARRIPHSDVDDALVEVFSVAWRRLADVPASEAGLWWLLRTASNVASTTNRAARRRMALTDRVAASLPGSTRLQAEDLPAHAASDDQVQAALAALADADRELLALRFWDELTPAEIAALHGVPLATAHKRLARARARFAAAYDRLAPRGVHNDAPPATSLQLDEGAP